MAAAQDDSLVLYVGTYTRREAFVVGKSAGIQICKFSKDTGEMSFVETITGITNPPFLAVHPNGRNLYSVSEMNERIEGRPAGGIAAFQIDPETGHLTYLNTQPSMGT